MKLWRKEKSLLYALHPEQIPEDGARFTYTYGLGGITILSALVTLLTGAALAFYYVPTPNAAHDSVVLIDNVASFGAIMRGLHYWGAQWMVIAATLHLARIVFTGGYRPPRELNWLIGLGLLVVTLLWDFTGYVLRWDAGAYWALLVGTNLVRMVPLAGEMLYRLLTGDAELGASALLRFYSWHVLGLFLLGGFGIVYHLWRLRMDGGISRPLLGPGESRHMISRDELFTREIIVAALVAAALIALALAFPVAIGPAADPAAGVTQVRAPWILLWVQSLLRVLPPFWAGIVAPLGLLALLAAIPWIDRRGPGRAVWFARERWHVQALFVLLGLVVVLLSLIEGFR